MKLAISTLILAAVLHSRPLAITNVSVLTMSSPTPVRSATVVIANGQISAIGPAATARIPRGSIRIDGTGKYLIPGLVDSHVHLPPSGPLSRAVCGLLVANGVTTVLNLRGTQAHIDLRNQTERNEQTCPTIYTSGEPVGTPHGATLRTSPDDIERAVVTQKRAGFDVIKLHGDLSRESYEQLMSVARRESIPVVGHAPRNLGLDAMLRTPQNAVAHIEEYLYAYFYFRRDLQEAIEDVPGKARFLAERTAAAGTAVITTITVFRGIAEQLADIDRVLGRPEMRFMPRALGDIWRWWKPSNSYRSRFGPDTIPWFLAKYSILEDATLAFARAGVPLLAGTDTPTPAVVPGFSLHDELRALVAAGLSPYEALRAGTANPAEFLKDNGGVIAPGRRANLILLGNNPLDDISLTTAIDGVVLRGRWLPATALRQMLAASSPAQQRQR